MSKLRLSDSILEIFTKMANGNPGAATVLAGLFKESPKIDPDAAMPEIMNIFALDDLGIYGSDIWILFKDSCCQNIEYLALLLRAFQLGFVDGDEVVAASKDRPRSCNYAFDFPALLAKVKERLPAFGENCFTNLT